MYPNVTSIPAQPSSSPGVERGGKATKGEFDQVFEKALDKGKAVSNLNALDDALGHVKQPLKFSAHASQRMRDRKINLDQATVARVSEAVDKAEAKGVDDTLVLTGDAALIVNVKNRTVITALDRNSLLGNVFTNIDGAVIV